MTHVAFIRVAVHPDTMKPIALKEEERRKRGLEALLRDRSDGWKRERRAKL
jgi:hypothetical protein